MIFRNLPLKQGRPLIRLSDIQFGARCTALLGANPRARLYGTERGISSQLKEEFAKEHVKHLERLQRARKDARAVDKDFFLSILGSSATKREAKAYLQRFNPSADVEAEKVTCGDAVRSHGSGVNLGGFYGPTAVQESPRFNQHPEKHIKLVGEPQLHVALVKIRAPQDLDDDTLEGIGKTLSQLGRLGLVSVVVVDCNNGSGPPDDRQTQPNWRATEVEQASRVVAAINASGDARARFVDNVIGISEAPKRPGYSQTTAHVTLRKLLMVPLRRGIIPVLPSLGYTDSSQTALPIAANDIVVALTRELAGIPEYIPPDEDPKIVYAQLQALRDEISLDRLIVLDPLGGIPATDRPNGYHVFLNMEQEFDSVKEALLRSLDKINHNTSLPSNSERFPTRNNECNEKHISKPWHHLQNLHLVKRVLSILPPSSSALLTTPHEAANSAREIPLQAARVGTRRQRNPLIHNLLTDKPVFSSSLPVTRLSHQKFAPDSGLQAERLTPTTFAKHGMSVSILPNPKLGPWLPPIPGRPHLSLTGSEVDLPRLVHLIEDSFGRKLDVKDYLRRVNDRVAGVIIAGEYEGGALLTWEIPPGVEDDGSLESRARMVPYLDKFAVLRRSQGSGGVADLIFKAMVRECLPMGVVWRSRKNNPVNKWYFERSRGTWKLPGTGWTMFWTTPELTLDKQRFLDYEGVCRGIEPSWADNKAMLD